MARLTIAEIERLRSEARIVMALERIMESLQHPWRNDDGQGDRSGEGPGGDSDGPRPLKLRRVDSNTDESRALVTSRHRPQPPPERPLKRKLDVMLGLDGPNPSGEPVRSNNTVAEPPSFERYTVLLWNVEQYGHFKAEANPWANRLIRQVIEEARADLVLLLETKSGVSEVVAALEHRTSNEMATSRQKRKTQGIDLTDKVRFTHQERHDLDDEERQRQEDLERNSLDDLVDDLTSGSSPTFFAVSSEIASKVRGLPPMLGPYLPRSRRGGEIARFKKAFSYVGTRLQPSWVAYFRELVVLYDVRLRKADADPDDESLDAFCAPLDDTAMADLEEAVRALCFDAADVEDFLKHEAFFNFTEENIAARRELIASLMQGLRDQGFGEDSPEMQFFQKAYDKAPMDDDQQGERARRAQRLRDWMRDNRDERLDLIARLNESLVFTLRQPKRCPTCGGTGKPSEPPSNGLPTTLPVREVIGLRNEGLTCYVNAALQLVLATGIANNVVSGDLEPLLQTYAGNPIASQVRLTLAALPLLHALRDQARGATYGYELPVPTGMVPTRAETIYARVSTGRIRELLRASRAIDGVSGRNEDAGEALRGVLMGFYRPERTMVSGHLVPGIDVRPEALRAHYTNPHQGDPQLQSPFHFVMRVARQYAPTEAEVTLEHHGHGQLPLTDQGWHFDYQSRDALQLDFMGQVQNTDVLQLARLIAQNRQVDNRGSGATALCTRNGDVFWGALQGTVENLQSAPPAKLIVQLKRFRMDQFGNVQRIGATVQVGEVECIFGGNYRLVAFVRHRGPSVAAGHYIAYVERGDTWYEIDDAIVTRAPDGLALARNSAYFYYFERIVEPDQERRVVLHTGEVVQ
jgi:Ubiquitin carboxyl-terminal hydrolase